MCRVESVSVSDATASPKGVAQSANFGKIAGNLQETQDFGPKACCIKAI